MSGKTFISVILPLRLEWEPCYMINEEDNVGVGDRVRVPFVNRIYTGVVSKIGITPETEERKIKKIISVENDLERISLQEMELWQKIASYYLCTIGEVYKAAYPSGKINLEEAKAAAAKREAQKAEAMRLKAIEKAETAIARYEIRVAKKRELLAKARKETTCEGYRAEIEKTESSICELRKEIERLNTCSESSACCNGSPTFPTASKHIEPKIQLSEPQNTAYEQIQKGFAANKPVLLDGVTGSGKTEIYIKAAQKVIASGKNVLYLVPEIALSSQLEERLETHFGKRLLTFHSSKSAASKRDISTAIRQQKNCGYIVLGTRSAIFLPHKNLGLIIIDEEHDNSYKQDSPAPRYNGRDAALMLGQIHGNQSRCNILLGSATPSLEEMYNCIVGRHIRVELREKYHGSETAGIEIIDTKEERRKRGMVGNFSRKLIEKINTALQNGEQVLILRSRRAWATALQCENCGEIARCPHCNVSLNYHKDASTGKEVCHYCGHSVQHTGKCPRCGGTLKPLGAGTQKIEEEATALFPNARIARLDSDTAKNRAIEAKTIKEFGKGNIDILIGTQIITKGFDFDNLSLVAVISADSMLAIQDFRADEKTLHLLEQFRGRCGRRGKKGSFIIQTSQPEHPIYRHLLDGEADTLNYRLLQERKDFLFPPYTRIIELTFKDRFEDKAQRIADKTIRALHNAFSTAAHDKQMHISEVYAPVVDKISDMYIRKVRLAFPKDKNLTDNKEKLMSVIRGIEQEYVYDGHIIIDVDPS